MNQPISSYKNTWEFHGVVTRFSGVVTANVYLASSAEIASDMRLDELQFVIKDFSDAAGIDIDPSMFEELAIIRFGVQATNPGARIVLVGTIQGITALADSLQAPPLKGSHETRAFATMAEAREWIGRQPWASTYAPHIRFS
jgi:hypothetical protein